jgi:hypothetical protein
MTFTRKGVEVFGWFDHMCGTGDTIELSWDDVDEIRSSLAAAGRRSDGA